MAAATISLFMFFLNIFSLATSQTTQSTINLGSQLLPTQEHTSWLSSSGRFAFGFYKQGDGFAVGIWLNQIPEKTVVWTAKRDDKPVSSDTTLLLTKEGWLVLRDKRGQDTPITNSSSSATYASMLNTGNFVLYNAVSEIVWQSFNNPTDTILANMTLSSRNQLFSSASETNHSRGRFRLKNQDDGNLVLYPVDTTDIAENSYWASGIFDQGYRPTLALDEDGHMYLFREDGKIVRNFTDGRTSRNQTVFYRATIDFDGIFRLYSHSVERNGSYSMEIRWSAIDDECVVKGICGFNSYCSLEDNRTGCLCLPGFDFIDPPQRFRGCERNFTEQSCGGRTDNLTYVMQTMENMVLEDDPYSISQVGNMDDCGKACLYDCTCHASLLRNGRCSKLKLPLRYGKTGTDNSTMIFIKVGDGTLESPNGTFPTRSEMRSKKMIRMDILAVSIALVTFSAIAILISCLLIYRYHRRSKMKSQKEDFGLMEEITLRSFSYDELKKATGNFKEELGNGAFGTVYKGVLSNGQKAIAVKTLTKMVREGEKEFQREMKAIGRTHHRNLIQLLGFCSEGSNRLLVYEYMKNGSLADLLFKDQRGPTWNERLRIALDVARGILYLHEDCEPHIIHCDIKPENILMDDLWTAKISDFGLAKLLMPNQTRTFTGPRGTRGYVAPEWHRNVPITVKADVYSFGIVLLEIVCCRRNLDVEAPESEIILCEWVYGIFVTGQLGKLMVGEDVEKALVDRMVKVGLWCIQNEPSLRPSMKNVILMLEGNTDIPIPPSNSF